MKAACLLLELELDEIPSGVVKTARGENASILNKVTQACLTVSRDFVERAVK
jgi:hypothetical protein